MEATIDDLIVEAVLAAGTDVVLSLPCSVLGGILKHPALKSLLHIPVCREEEGVGIGAGAALAGKRPLLLMQNSGFGNCVNALLSLTGLYGLPLFMLMSHRGGGGETIAAQIPMGVAVPKLLRTLLIPFQTIRTRSDVGALRGFMSGQYSRCAIGAALLAPELWDAKN
jgi:sulfopyruvate decarboxylase alpha subunit